MLKLKNDGATTLSADINSSVTHIEVTDGSVFPTLGTGDWFPLTLIKNSNVERMQVIARGGNTLTVIRGAESTNAQAWVAGDNCTLSITAGVYDYTGAGVKAGLATGITNEYPNKYDLPASTQNNNKYPWSSFNQVVVNNRFGMLLNNTVGRNTSVSFLDPQNEFPSGFISAGALWVSKTSSYIEGEARQIILQYNAAGDEIARHTIEHKTSTIINNEYHDAVGITLLPTTKRVVHFLDVYNQGEVIVTDCYCADGAIGGFRAPAPVKVINSVSVSKVDDAVNGLAVAAYMSKGAAGLSEKYPNLHIDPTGEQASDDPRWAGVDNKLVYINGQPALRHNSTIIFTIDNPTEAFPSGFISAGALWVEKKRDSRPRQLIIQSDADGVELERDTIQFLLPDSWNEGNPQWHESYGVVLNPLATKVQQYFDTPTYVEYYTVTNFYISDGALSGFRAPIPATTPILLADMQSTKAIISSSLNISATLYHPNLLTDPLISNLWQWDNNDNVSTRWDAGLNKMVLDCIRSEIGLPAFKIYPEIDLIGDTEFSWQVNIVSKTAGYNYGRVFVVQYDDGVELTRSSLSSTALGNAKAGDTVRFEGVSIESGCNLIVFYIDTGNTLGEGFSLTDICLRGGGISDQTAFKAVSKLPQQINLFPTSEYANLEARGRMSFNYIDGVPTITCVPGGGATGTAWYLPARTELAPLKTVNIGCQYELTETTPGDDHIFSFTIIYLDEDKNEIGRVDNDSVGYSGYIDQEVVIPSGTKYIKIRAYFWGTSTNTVGGTVKDVYVAVEKRRSQKIVAPTEGSTSASSTNIAYVSTLGDDLGKGTLEDPLLSFDVAASLLSGVGIIKVINDGVYLPQTIATENAINLIVTGDGFFKPHIRGGSRKTSWTLLEEGETNVWHTTTIAISTRWIWEGYKNDESTLITDAERQTEHHGRTHRLEHTKLYLKSDLVTLKAASQGYWYDTVNGELYVKPANTYTDIADAWIMYPTDTGISCAAVGKITLIDLVVDFAGINVSESAFSELHNIEAIGSKGQGLMANDTRGSQYNCRWAAADNDGANYHNTLDVDLLGTVFYSFDTWSHDCGDDGDSMHEHCVGYYTGGLYEYNADRGCAPAYGSHTKFTNVKTRRNGHLLEPTSGTTGEGIGLVGSSPEAGGYGTSVECFNCVDTGSMYGFANHGSDSGDGELSSMKLYGCISKEAITGAYSARGGSILELINCYESDTVGVVKHEMGGVVLVHISNIVV
jgi:hypothetical protein